MSLGHFYRCVALYIMAGWLDQEVLSHASWLDTRSMRHVGT